MGLKTGAEILVTHRFEFHGERKILVNSFFKLLFIFVFFFSFAFAKCCFFIKRETENKALPFKATSVNNAKTRKVLRFLSNLGKNIKLICRDG